MAKKPQRTKGKAKDNSRRAKKRISPLTEDKIDSEHVAEAASDAACLVPWAGLSVGVHGGHRLSRRHLRDLRGGGIQLPRRRRGVRQARVVDRPVHVAIVGQAELVVHLGRDHGR